MTTLRVHHGPVASVQLNGNGLRVAAFGDAGRLVVYDVGRTEKLMDLAAPVASVLGRRFRCWLAGDGSRLATNSPDRRAAEVYDVDGGRLLGRHEVASPITALFLSRRGEYLLTGHYDGTVCLKRADSREHLFTGACGVGFVKCVYLGPEAKHVATGDMYGVAGLWDVASGRQVVHERGTWGYAWINSNGSRFVSIGGLGLRYRDAKTGDPVGSGHISADGGFLFRTEPDEAAPSGWFWTNRPEFVRVFEVAPDGKAGRLIEPGDPRRKAYLGVFNNREMAMAKLNGQDAYKTEAVRFIEGQNEHRRLADLGRQLALPGGDGSGESAIP